MTTTCTISGILYDPTGAVWGNAEVTLRAAPPEVIVTTGGTVNVPVPRVFTTGADGLLTMALAPGQYRGTARGAGGESFSFDLPVPDLASAPLKDWIGRQNVALPSVAQAGNMPVKLITGTAYTIDQIDAGVGLKTTNSSLVTLTLPKTFAAGFSCAVFQWGNGQAFLSPESGAALDHSLGLTRTYGPKAMLSLWVHDNADGVSARWAAAGDML